eukprot:11790146-Alexandrium_andersonii.AAC.1
MPAQQSGGAREGVAPGGRPTRGLALLAPRAARCEAGALKDARPREPSHLAQPFVLAWFRYAEAA